MPRKTNEKDEEINKKSKEKEKKRGLLSSLLSKKDDKKAETTKLPKQNKTEVKQSNTKEVTNKKEEKATKSTTKKKSVANTKTENSLSASDTKAKTILEKESTSKETSSLTNKKTKSTSSLDKNTKTKTTKTSNKTTAKKGTSTTIEYYDLPFRYNQTVVKILAQTPNNLFIYWDISDNDRNSYIEKYGPDFFQNTRPYLIIKNETMNYTFEVEINDFANSWYLHVNDPGCTYKVELGRKFIVNSLNQNNTSNQNRNTYKNYSANEYLYITTSNGMEMPNNHILFDKLGKNVFFRNIKTNVIEQKNISSMSFLQNIGKVYDIYDLYKEIYAEELISDEFKLDLPSSSSSSSFK